MVVLSGIVYAQRHGVGRVLSFAFSSIELMFVRIFSEVDILTQDGSYNHLPAASNVPCRYAICSDTCTGMVLEEFEPSDFRHLL